MAVEAAMATGMVEVEVVGNDGKEVVMAENRRRQR
jgi:hypothetical protein